MGGSLPRPQSGFVKKSWAQTKRSHVPWKVFGLLISAHQWALLAALRISGFGQWKEGREPLGRGQSRSIVLLFSAVS